jgi:hypothetical protein
VRPEKIDHEALASRQFCALNPLLFDHVAKTPETLLKMGVKVFFAPTTGFKPKVPPAISEPETPTTLFRPDATNVACTATAAAIA